MVKAMENEGEKRSGGQLCRGRLEQPGGKVPFREQHGVVQQRTVIQGHPVRAVPFPAKFPSLDLTRGEEIERITGGEKGSKSSPCLLESDEREAG